MGGYGGREQVKGITPIVLRFHAVLLYVFLPCVKLRLYRKLHLINVDNIGKILMLSNNTDYLLS